MATEYRNKGLCQKTSAFVLGFNWHFSLLNRIESPFGTAWALIAKVNVATLPMA
jgi:hypothetical protein